MKQLFQILSNGKTIIDDVPVPQLLDGHALINTTQSLISSGTEKMLVDFSKSSLIEKARKQPSNVKRAIEKIKSDGIATTLNAVQTKMSEPLPMGYCNIGNIIESNISGINSGDRVVSNGNHAEVVRAPKNLIAKVPSNVDDDTATFTVIGSIALQGIRLLNPTIGETIVVQGLGLVGLMAVQILKANGCNVIGIDLNKFRCDLAKKYGANAINLSENEDPVIVTKQLTSNNGADGVLVCTASNSEKIISQAAKMSRNRGRIILVGVAGLNFDRNDFYKKELSFQVSCSYGPGRYDLEYEKKGNDYPIGHVRWTEKRNFEAILNLMNEGKIDVKSMITNRFPFKEAPAAYELLNDDKPYLGILLDYDKKISNIQNNKITINENIYDKVDSKPTLGFIGSGNYAKSILIPAFKNLDVNLKVIASSGGSSALSSAKKFGFTEATTDLDLIFNDRSIDSIVVATRHNTHAELIIRALKSGKNIFVEKPLALTMDEIKNVSNVYKKNKSSQIMIGFNRRFSPFTAKIKKLIDSSTSPRSMIMTVNAGALPNDHWAKDPKVGGGRIIGEACHFIDLMRFLADSPIADFKVFSMKDNQNDTISINLSFVNGSIGTIHYFANGNRLLSKERLEVYFDGKTLILDNFKKLIGYGINRFSKLSKFKQDKGQKECAKAFIDSIISGSPKIPIDQIFEVSETAIKINNAIL